MTATTLTVAGVEIPRIGLGTNRLTHTPENVAFIREAVAAGVGMIDTAHLYTGGESEATIGEALSPKPAGVVVATKGGYGGAGRGAPEALDAEIEESLRRLRTDRIDLYYLHRVDPDTPLETSLGAIKEHVDAGRIAHVGLSEVSVEQIERGRRVVPIAAVQNHYNASERGHEDVVDHCAREGIPFVPYFPLRGDDRPAAEALAWLLDRSPTMLPIPGTLSIEHLRENLAVLQA
jgi:aryl-alcohol dehydrogenase-like predicted oxidoreductase